MESGDNKEVAKHADSRFNKEIHSKVVRAGKRTYFFDVKSTRNNEYYLTITESKKRYTEQGKFHFEKHKIFLYKEDFEKFTDSLLEIVDYIRQNQPEQEVSVEKETEVVESTPESAKDFSDIDFEDI